MKTEVMRATMRERKTRVKTRRREREGAGEGGVRGWGSGRRKGKEGQEDDLAPCDKPFCSAEAFPRQKLPVLAQFHTSPGAQPVLATLRGFRVCPLASLFPALSLFSTHFLSCAARGECSGGE
jgi:hypothetical protein